MSTATKKKRVAPDRSVPLEVDALNAADGSAALTGQRCRLNADTDAGQDAKGDDVTVRTGTHVVFLSTVESKDGVPTRVTVRAQDGGHAGLLFIADYDDLERAPYG